MEGGGDSEALSHSAMEDPMEFLSRSWSVSALEVSRAMSASPTISGEDVAESILELPEEEVAAVAGSDFSFASSATSQLVLERMMSPLQEVSPLTSDRLSHSSGPLNGGGSLSNSPTLSPSDLQDVKTTKATGSSGCAHETFFCAQEQGLHIRYETVSDGLPVEFDRSLHHDEFMGLLLHNFSDHVVSTGHVAKASGQVSDNNSNNDTFDLHAEYVDLYEKMRISTESDLQLAT